MSIHVRMNKENVYAYSGILFGHSKEENSAICNNIDSEDTMLSAVSYRETNTVRFHLHVESLTFEFTETE